MPITVNKSIDFNGQNFFIGIDVHKHSWTVTIRSFGIEISHFTQEADPYALHHYLQTRYPGGNYISAYEAGFSGTWNHTNLCRCGIKNVIIHPADLPQSDKQKKNKTDLHDSRALAKYLEAGMLSGIYIMDPDQQERRCLFRCREAKVADITRCTCRLRSFLDYNGVELPDIFKDKEYICRNFLSWLSKLQLKTAEGTFTLHHYVEELKYHRQHLLEITRTLKKSVIAFYKESYWSLKTVPGIGTITAIALLVETGDLCRFERPDEYTSYLGLVPSERSSGDTVYSNRLQPRCNTHLRPLLIEAAWVAIRQSPELLLYFKKHVGKNNKKAIVKVARKLALIAKAVAINKTTYNQDLVVSN